MSFQEKSAWIMSLALALGGIIYFSMVLTLSEGIQQLVPPLMPVVIVYTVILIVIAVIGHIVMAIAAPRDASEEIDERGRLINDRAGNYSSYVLAVGVLLGLGIYLISFNGHLLFYTVFASLMLSQLSEYLLQIWLNRSVF